MRRFSEASADKLRTGIDDTLQGVARAHGVDVEIDYGDEYPLTVNDAAEVEFTHGVVDEVFGEGRYVDLPDPITGSEDFSRVLAAVPGAFVFLGATPPGLDPRPPLQPQPARRLRPHRPPRGGRALRRAGGAQAGGAQPGGPARPADSQGRKRGDQVPTLGHLDRSPQPCRAGGGGRRRWCRRRSSARGGRSPRSPGAA